MSQFIVKPDLYSISKSKRKFLYMGLFLLIVNFYFVFRYVLLATSTEPKGYYLLIMTFLNFPLFIISMILLFVPLMYKKSFASKTYEFTEAGLTIGDKKIQMIKLVEMTEFVPGFYKVQFWYSEEGHQYQLEGVSYPDVRKIIAWCEEKNITVE